ncbi:uncharacterized protein BJ171DRAFT_422919 [Polychytrium aggregatum]|uniref:uncharacterized protein n=1 Tax=Polychytrium aggregatum TaxID=110093 RepID=UPI0022FE2022|nr:uncharacterized protein BJ171DRAFT_422919 [Polychytrium aggregatum]KAI9205666.1 hypothetical protein BJ171DRAFT_422919 [Polychytrium aggregatum]
MEPKTIPPLETVVILVRHAEKLVWEQGLCPEDHKLAKAAYVDDHQLSSKGWERAHALVPYFQHRGEMGEILQSFPLGGIIGQDVDLGPEPFGQSERCLQTVEPLSQATGIPITRFIKRDFAEAIEAVRARAEWKGRSVVVSWAHQMLRDWALALGVDPAEIPGKWPGKRYDLTWVIVPGAGADGRPQLRQYCQRLLYGDSDKILTL